MSDALSTSRSRAERRLRRTKPAPASGETRLAGGEPGLEQSGGLFVPGEAPGHLAPRGLQGRPTSTSDEGYT